MQQWQLGPEVAKVVVVCSAEQLLASTVMNYITALGGEVALTADSGVGSLCEKGAAACA